MQAHRAAVLEDVGHGGGVGPDGLLVQAHAGGDGLREPEQADVGQQLVPADAGLQLPIHPPPHLLNDPGQQACMSKGVIIM